jgi:hypothetical protein
MPTGTIGVRDNHRIPNVVRHNGAVTGRYGGVRAYLEQQLADEPVSLSMPEIDRLVGGLPPSAGDRTWWANTRAHTQARSWLDAGRRVSEVRLGEAVTFSPTELEQAAESEIHATPPAGALPDGVAALERMLARAGHKSIAHAVAAHTVFLPPATVRQTDGQPLFPIIRNPFRRGEFETLPSGQTVMYDDNTTPKQVFFWASRARPGRDVQLNHLWGDPKSMATYTAAWNLALTPAFLAKTTDGSNHPEVLAVLRYRSLELFGSVPAGEERPKRPPDYQEFEWPDMPAPVDDLEGILRARLRSARKSRAAAAAREIGWLFSDWQPDPHV